MAKSTYVESIMTKFRLAKGGQLSIFSKDAIDWFRKTIRKSYTHIKEKQTLQQAKETRSTVKPGEMVFFIYDAKYKDELPYWDAFPLSINLGHTDEYMWGINLHYLDPVTRGKVFLELLGYHDNKYLTKIQRLALSWKFLMLLKDSKYFRFAIKKYRMDHVKSQIVIVPYEEWPIAIFLPNEAFQKADNQRVWRDGNSYRKKK